MDKNRPLPQHMGVAVDAAIAALGAAGIAATPIGIEGPNDSGLDISIDDRRLSLAVKAVSYCTGQRARELIARSGSLSAGTAPLVVAERITAEARALLTDAGWSWLDRRGRFHLRGPGIRVDLDIPSQGAAVAGRSTRQPITGRGALNVAYWLCDHPGEVLSPTRSAPDLGLAPSTISDSVHRLMDVGFVDDDGTGLFPELFWELAEAWPTDRTWLNGLPDPADHVVADHHGSMWRRTGTAAAVAYGAPIVSSEAGPIELYVPGPVSLSSAVRRYGVAQPGTGVAVLAVAPVAAVTVCPGDSPVPFIGGWPTAPLLAVALDLARDRARGREILAEWKDPSAVWL